MARRRSVLTRKQDGDFDPGSKEVGNCGEGDEAAVCADADDCDDDGSTVLLAPLAVGETTLEDFGGLKKRLPGGLEEKKE